MASQPQKPKARKSLAFTPSAPSASDLNKENKDSKPSSRVRSKSLGPGGLNELETSAENGRRRRKEGRRRRETTAPLPTIPKSILKPALPLSPPKLTKSARRATTHMFAAFVKPPQDDPKPIPDLLATGSNPTQTVPLLTEEEQAARERDRQRKEILKAREERRKSMGNRRVSFAPEATLHTWDATHFEAGSEGGLPEMDLGITPTVNRVGFAAPELSSEDESALGSDDVLGRRVEEEEEVGEVTRMLDGEPESSSDDDEEESDSEVTESSGSERTRSDAGEREGQEFGGGMLDMLDEMDMGEDVTSSLKSYFRKPITVVPAEDANTDTNTEDKENKDRDEEDATMDVTMDMTRPVGGIVNKQQQLPQPPSSDDGGDMTMDMTRPVGGIITKPQPPSSDDGGDDMTMDMTRPVGGIITRPQHQQDSSDDEGGDMTMDITRPVGGIVTNNTLAPHQNQHSDDDMTMDMTMDMTKPVGRILSQHHSDDEDVEMEEATMDMTVGVGKIITNEGYQQAGEKESSPLSELEEEGLEDMSMEFTAAIGKVLASKNAQAVPAPVEEKPTGRRQSLRNSTVKATVETERRTSTGRRASTRRTSKENTSPTATPTEEKAPKKGPSPKEVQVNKNGSPFTSGNVRNVKEQRRKMGNEDDIDGVTMDVRASLEGIEALRKVSTEGLEETSETVQIEKKRTTRRTSTRRSKTPTKKASSPPKEATPVPELAPKSVLDTLRSPSPRVTTKSPTPLLSPSRTLPLRTAPPSPPKAPALSTPPQLQPSRYDSALDPSLPLSTRVSNLTPRRKRPSPPSSSPLPSPKRHRSSSHTPPPQPKTPAQIAAEEERTQELKRSVYESYPELAVEDALIERSRKLKETLMKIDPMLGDVEATRKRLGELEVETQKGEAWEAKLRAEEEERERMRREQEEKERVERVERERRERREELEKVQNEEKRREMERKEVEGMMERAEKARMEKVEKEREEEKKKREREREERKDVKVGRMEVISLRLKVQTLEQQTGWRLVSTDPATATIYTFNRTLRLTVPASGTPTISFILLPRVPPPTQAHHFLLSLLTPSLTSLSSIPALKHHIATFWTEVATPLLTNIQSVSHRGVTTYHTEAPHFHLNTILLSHPLRAKIALTFTLTFPDPTPSPPTVHVRGDIIYSKERLTPDVIAKLNDGHNIAWNTEWKSILDGIKGRVEAGWKKTLPPPTPKQPKTPKKTQTQTQTQTPKVTHTPPPPQSTRRTRSSMGGTPLETHAPPPVKKALPKPTRAASAVPRAVSREPSAPAALEKEVEKTEEEVQAEREKREEEERERAEREKAEREELEREQRRIAEMRKRRQGGIPVPVK